MAMPKRKSMRQVIRAYRKSGRMFADSFATDDMRERAEELGRLQKGCTALGYNWWELTRTEMKAIVAKGVRATFTD
jgi:hypothetical protein